MHILIFLRRGSNRFNYILCYKKIEHNQMTTTTQGILMGRRTDFLTKWLPRHPSQHEVKKRTAGQEWEALPAGSQRTRRHERCVQNILLCWEP